MSTSSCLDMSGVSIVKVLDVSMEPSWKDYYLEQTVKLSSFRNDKKEDNLPEHLLAPLLLITFPLHIVYPLHR